MGFAPAGIKLIVGGVLAAAIGGVVIVWCRVTGMTILGLGLVFAAFSAYFFRDPERDKVFAPGEIACPADGTVMTVRNEGKPGITVVRIFLSVLNVHVQRAPMEGKVEKTLYTKAVRQGERVGMIYFGSQVAVYLPDTVRVLVNPGDKVEGAETVLALW